MKLIVYYQMKIKKENMILIEEFEGETLFDEIDFDDFHDEQIQIYEIFLNLCLDDEIDQIDLENKINDEKIQNLF